MKDDASLNDEDLEGEIRLVGDLVLAASQSESRLSDSEIDAVLGIDRSVPGADSHEPVPDVGAEALPREPRAS